MTTTTQTDVAVIGGGLSGLTTAHFLAAAGLESLVVEKQDRTGGTIRTTRIDDFLVEHGPNTALDTTPLLHQLVADLEIEDELEYAGESAKNRYVVRGGMLHPLPMSPPAMIRSKLFSTRAKLRLLKEPFIRPAPAASEETLSEFTKRRLGREFLDYAIDAFVAGVFAGVPEELSVRSAFPKLYELEQQYGSLIKGAIRGARERRKRQETSKQSARIYSFRKGLQTLVDALAARCGEGLRPNTAVHAIRKIEEGGFELDLETAGRAWQLQARGLVFAIPAHAYESLEFEFDLAVGKVLEQIYYPPVAMIFFGYRDDPGGRPRDGFGFLVPRREERQILGTLWNSTLFTGRAPAGGAALTTFAGGSRQPENGGWPDERLIETVQQELRELMGIQRPPDEIFIQRWPRAIPQYRPGHQHLIDELAAAEKRHPGLYISGNFRNGISIADCIQQASALSERVVAELGQT